MAEWFRPERGNVIDEMASARENAQLVQENLSLHGQLDYASEELVRLQGELEQARQEKAEKEAELAQVREQLNSANLSVGRWRKEATEQSGTLELEARSSTAEKLLPLIDSVYAPKDERDSVMKGALINVLSGLGVSEIDAVGTDDPLKTEAIGFAEGVEGKVAKVLRPGYEIKVKKSDPESETRVLRPAMVFMGDGSVEAPKGAPQKEN